ncbi:MAG: hypothetical protein ACOCP4_02435 [Candidatus Woesearchaeota archaeon]
MFRNSLQRRLQEMERESPSPSLETAKPTIKERVGFLGRYFSRAVEQVPQKEHNFGDLNDELNHYRYSENFDRVSLLDKVRIYKECIDKTDISEPMRNWLADDYLEDVLKAKENPKSYPYFWTLGHGKSVPKTIVCMLQTMYDEIVPTEARKRALEWYESSQETLKRGYELFSERGELPDGNSLTDSINYMRLAFDYLIDANQNVGSEQYRQIGDVFYNSAKKLDQMGNRNGAQSSIRIALDFYQDGKISIPGNLRENWLDYVYGKSNVLRTDWKTAERDPMKLLTS